MSRTSGILDYIIVIDQPEETVRIGPKESALGKRLAAEGTLENLPGQRARRSAEGARSYA